MNICDKMYIIIGGCGRIGSNLAELLVIEGNDVVVIDKEESSFDKLSNKFSGSTVIGNFSDESTLEKAGAESSDVIIAVTDDDNANVVGCQIGKEVFGVEKTVARINNPMHEESYLNFDVDELITPTKEIISLFKNAVSRKEINSKLILGDNDIELIELRVSKDIGKLSDFEVPNDFKLCAIEQSGDLNLPTEEDEIQAGDRLYLITKVEDVNKNRDWIKKWV